MSDSFTLFNYIYSQFNIYYKRIHNEVVIEPVQYLIE